MISRSSMAFLQRQRILNGSYPGAKYYPGSSRVHFRPVRFLPELLAADTPARRVLTQPDSQRVPYKGVVGTDQDCGDCTPNNA